MNKENFISFFQKELFVPDLKAASKKAALKKLCSLMVKREKIKNEKVLLHTLLEREKLGTTGIGESIAIPHGRSLMVPKLMLVFARSKAGIDFESVDGKPVHLIFLIVAPPIDEGNMYLPLLGKLIELVRDKKNRKTILEIPNYRELIKFLNEKA